MSSAKTIFLLLSLLPFSLTSAGELKLIRTLTPGNRAMDLIIPDEGYVTSWAGLPSFLSHSPDEKIWISDPKNFRIMVFDLKGNFIKTYNHPRDVHGCAPLAMIGFTSENDCYFHYYGTYIDGNLIIGRWDIKENILHRIPISLSNIDLSLYYDNPDHIKSRQGLFGYPYVQGNYIIYKQSDPSKNAPIFALDGRYVGQVPFDYWSNAGVGARFYSIKPTIFYITENANINGKIEKEIKFNISDVINWNTFLFNGMDEEGNGYFMGVNPYSMNYELGIIKFNPFTQKVEKDIISFQSTREKDPHLSYNTKISNKGDLVFSMAQPVDRWDIEEDGLGGRYISNLENLRIYIYKYSF